MMEILADESVDYRLVKYMRNLGYQVVSVLEACPGVSDDQVLKIAKQKRAILLTEDKDFGALTFRLKKSNNGIVLLRFSGIPIESKKEIIKNVLKLHAPQLIGNFTVISSEKCRIRKMT